MKGVGIFMKIQFEEKLFQLVEKERIKTEEALSKHTTFKIGGPADYFFTPQNEEEIAKVIELCKEENVPFYIIGNGSNLLVGDKGYRGMIIQIYRTMNQIETKKEGNLTFVKAGAGVMLSKLAMDIAELSLTGFEFAAGIPGTLGGAVTMNAGAYGGEMKDYIVKARVLTRAGEFLTLEKEELQLSYRNSIIQKEHYIVLDAVFAFGEGKKEEILEKIMNFNKQRKEKQPLEYPSAGSTFKRPEGQFAGKLIMEAGLKGFRVGDMMVSEKHCGFVVNVGNGTSKQAAQLMEEVDNIVFDKYQVHLEPEVRFVGEF